MVETLTYAEIDRLFFEHLRRNMVTYGRLPDILQYNNAPGAWRDAREAIAASGVGLIDVYGDSAEVDKDAKSFSRFVIINKGETPGSVSGTGTFYFEHVSGEGAGKIHSKKVNPDISEDIEYEIRVISNNVADDRFMRLVLKNLFGGRRYLTTVDATGNYTEKRALVEYNGSVTMSYMDVIERVYKYTVRDVFIQEHQVIQANIPALSTVNYSLYLIPSDDMIEEYIIDNPTTASDEPWQDITINIPDATTLVTHEKLKGDLKKIIFLNDYPMEFAKKGIVHNATAGTLDFTSLGTIGGADVYLTFEYRNLPT